MSKKKMVKGGAIALCVAGAVAATSVSAARMVDHKSVSVIEDQGHIRDNIRLAGLSSVLSGYMDKQPVAEDVTVGGEKALSAGVDAAVMDGGVSGIEAAPAAGVNMVIAESNQDQEDDSWKVVSGGVNAVAMGYAQEGPEVSVTFEERGMQTAGREDSSARRLSRSKSEKTEKMSEEEREWQNYLMADVKEYLNVRASKKDDAEVVGKLRKGDRALIRKTGKIWTKVASGNVEGYVKTEYCVTGKDALAYAKKNCVRVAAVESEGLRVRKTRSTEAEVVSRAEEGDILEVNGEAKEKKGWVAVKTDSGEGFVKADYVKVSYKTTKAITVEEEEEIKAAERAEEEREKEQEKEQTKANSESSDEKLKKEQGKAEEASADEETLLAALIYCEAGGENYDCQLAVGAVVVNRIQSGSFPGSMKGVIYQSGQFGPARTGKLGRVLRGGISSTSRKAAREALSGVDNTGGCLYFNDACSTSHKGKLIDSMMFW